MHLQHLLYLLGLELCEMHKDQIPTTDLRAQLEAGADEVAEEDTPPLTAVKGPMQVDPHIVTIEMHLQADVRQDMLLEFGKTNRKAGSTIKNHHG